MNARRLFASRSAAFCRCRERTRARVLRPCRPEGRLHGSPAAGSRHSPSPKAWSRFLEDRGDRRRRQSSARGFPERPEESSSESRSRRWRGYVPRNWRVVPSIPTTEGSFTFAIKAHEREQVCSFGWISSPPRCWWAAWGTPPSSRPLTSRTIRSSLRVPSPRRDLGPARSAECASHAADFWNQR
jgi:hypothetical protein